ncbi:hypothetical protein ACFY7H_01355 [Streptomyces sp. NPDC012794]|uniref:hypothetical protein n=1 Tax=Streptomyces sp. NPDC012794 TaxID=3364850 RepID=UPI00367545E3
MTTLSLRPEAIAEAGIGMLVAVLEHGEREAPGALVATRLDIRASSVRPAQPAYTSRPPT